MDAIAKELRVLRDEQQTLTRSLAIMAAADKAAQLEAAERQKSITASTEKLKTCKLQIHNFERKLEAMCAAARQGREFAEAEWCSPEQGVDPASCAVAYPNCPTRGGGKNAYDLWKEQNAQPAQDLAKKRPAHDTAPEAEKSKAEKSNAGMALQVPRCKASKQAGECKPAEPAQKRRRPPKNEALCNDRAWAEDNWHAVAEDAWLNEEALPGILRAEFDPRMLQTMKQISAGTVVSMLRRFALLAPAQRQNINFAMRVQMSHHMREVDKQLLPTLPVFLATHFLDAHEKPTSAPAEKVDLTKVDLTESDDDK